MIIVFSYLKRFKIAAMAIWPFILVAKPEYKTKAVLVNHERIHLRQQVETLLIGFIILYFGQYFFFLIIKNYSHRRSYKSLMMEKEARLNEKQFDFLDKRKLFNWKYFIYNKH